MIQCYHARLAATPLRLSFSGNCARPCGSERASGRIIDGPGGGDCGSTSPRSLDELAQLWTHTAHYSPVMIAPLSINTSHADCRPERSCFGGCHHIQSRSHREPPVAADVAALASSSVGCRASANGCLCRLSSQPLP